MKNNSIATINASTLAPLCRNLNNKARKQTKVTEAKMVTPINGITSPNPNIAVHRQPVGAPVFSRIGSKLLPKTKPTVIRYIVITVLLLAGVRSLLKAFGI